MDSCFKELPYCLLPKVLFIVTVNSIHFLINTIVKNNEYNKIIFGKLGAIIQHGSFY